MSVYAAGIDLGGTRLKFAAVSDAGDVLLRTTVPTGETRGDWIAAAGAEIAGAEAELGPATAVGVASPGLAARNQRTIAWMQGRMAAVQDLDWTEALGSRKFVPVMNDAHAALLGETWCGAARNCANALLLTLGTGVGGAAMVDGQLLRGHIGRAGHLGHISLDACGELDITGTPGSLEDAIGECTILARSSGRFASTEELLIAGANGDAHAREVWVSSVNALAAGLTSLINVLDPETILLGGGISNAGSALIEPLARRLNETEWRPTGGRVNLVFAALGDWAGAIGAARNGLIMREERSGGARLVEIK